MTFCTDIIDFVVRQDADIMQTFSSTPELSPLENNAPQRFLRSQCAAERVVATCSWAT